MIAKARERAPRGPAYAPTGASRASQVAHLNRLKAEKRFPGCEFDSIDNLAKHIAYGEILTLLVRDYAEQKAREPGAPEGFLRELAARVSRADNLDLEGMKQAVRNAIEIYVREIATGSTETNLDDICARALQKARAQFDRGQSALADATLTHAAEELERDEKDRREHYEASIAKLRHRQRDLALAGFEPARAAEAILALGRALHGDARALAGFLDAEAAALHTQGEHRGSNVHLIAEIALRREALALASGRDARAQAGISLGNALAILGARESGTARLEEANAVYRTALEDLSQERAPMNWAIAHVNLANTLWTLGQRETGVTRLKEATETYRAALTEFARHGGSPRYWTMTVNNLGLALLRLGERENDAARINEAALAFRAALSKCSREREPMDWAQTQMNYGLALAAAGEREQSIAKLEAAVAAYNGALEERTRDRAPVDWAMTMHNLASALTGLGERGSGVARLKEALAAGRAALEERTRERAPLDWALTQNNLGDALLRLGEREGNLARMQEGLDACYAALEELTPERDPAGHAMAQRNLARALEYLRQRSALRQV